LKDERHNRAANRQAGNNGCEEELGPRSEQEKEVWKALDQARQNVKPIVKKELDAEIVTSDLFNLRLRNPSR